MLRPDAKVVFAPLGVILEDRSAAGIARDKEIAGAIKRQVRQRRLFRKRK